jgi:hypothetical protein
MLFSLFGTATTIKGIRKEVKTMIGTAGPEGSLENWPLAEHTLQVQQQGGMTIDLVRLMCTAQRLRPPDKVPGVTHKGVEMCLKTKNNVGIPKEAFLFLLEVVGAELAEELPGFSVPVDKKGDKFLVTINSKETFRPETRQ